jgi:hypothetical protein
MTNTTRIAECCHEANLALCEAFGDLSQPHWEDAPDWAKDSAIAGVAFLQDHPDAGPVETHENWIREKVASGWKWGPIKDVRRKEHPSMKEYGCLSREEQAKDYVFWAIVKTLSREL